MVEDQTTKALDRIATCSDPKKLQQIAENALNLGEFKVRHAALLRLYSVLPSAKPGTLEHSVWQSVHALEGALTEERSKTTRLARTRQKIARDGERKTVADLVLGKVSEGFRMLLDREMPEFTFEAVALNHAGELDDAVVAAARARLDEAGVDPRLFMKG